MGGGGVDGARTPHRRPSSTLALLLPNLVTSDEPCPALGLTLSICMWGRQDLLQQGVSHAKPRVSAVLTGVLVLLVPGP